MPVLHFATFLKLLALSTGDKMRAIAKYGDADGGFDYWKPLRSGCIQYCAHGASRPRVHSHITSNAGSTNETRCIEKFEITANWMDRQAGQGFAPNRGVWRSPTGAFSVHIEPEIGFETSNRNKITAVYPTSSASLNRETAGAGILLLSQNYRDRSDEVFGIFEVDTNRCYRTPTNNSEGVLLADIATIDAAFARLNL